MGRRGWWLAGMSVAALGYVGVRGLRALLGWRPDAAEEFLRWTGPTATGIDVGSGRVDLPIFYYRDDSFLGIFTADREAVRALLPSDRLHPVVTPGGRALVGIAAFHYIHTTIGPYGEVAIALLCTYGRPAPPGLPLLLESRFPGWGAFILHLPVTTRIARDAGRVIYGYAKFLADMDFEKTPAFQRVRLSEGGRHILTLTVRSSGPVIRDLRPLVTFSVRDGALIRTTIPIYAVYQLGLRPGSGALILGDHPVADQLRSLDLSPVAVATRNYLVRYAILPAGEAIDSAARPHAPYPGEDRPVARLTVRYGEAATPVIIHSPSEDPGGLRER